MEANVVQQIIFLVTSLEGLHKPNFTHKLAQALQTRATVKILVAMVDCEAVWHVRRFLNQLAKDDAQIAQVELVTLSGLFADAPGLDLAADERQALDLTAYEERLFVDADQQVKRYLHHGHLVAEQQQIDDQTPMILRQYTADQLTQVDTYDLNGRVVGISQQVNGEMQTGYLLNQRGQAAIRFTHHKRNVRRAYNLSDNSPLMATKFSDAKEAALVNALPDNQAGKAPEETVDRTQIINTTEDYYGVLIYATYQRYPDLFAFYQTLIDRVMTDQTQLYIDIAVNAVLSPRMPHRLIFNY